MRFSLSSFLLAIFLLLPLAQAETPGYAVRNQELGIVYRPVDWDRKQWDAVFRDPATPVGWAIMPIGKESCSAITSWWVSGAKQKGLRLAILLDPFLNSNEIKKTIDCAVPLGIERAILDEYVSYQSKNLNRPVCTVLSETKSIYDYAKGKYPFLEIGIDDNWQTWIAELGRGQSDQCGTYPYFRYDLTGISVLSKYGNPATGTCGHPTVAEMTEQLLDLKPTVRDYSKRGKIFVWQLNQHWFPGGQDVLQFFRQLKAVYGWQRFFLFGPTSDNVQGGNWGYSASASRDGCFPAGFQWYLPARDFLIRITEGSRTSIHLDAPSSSVLGSVVTLRGKIRTPESPIAVNNVQLQILPPVGTVNSFHAELIAPPKARVAVVGVRINTQIPRDIKGVAQFSLDRVQLFNTGDTRNLVSNGEFINGLSNWLLISTAPAGVVSNGIEKTLQASCTSDQFISLSSFPIFVTPGRSYTVNFDSGIFQEARNNGYFFVSWNEVSEIRRDKLFLTFPIRTTVAATASKTDGTFTFRWQPDLRGVYTLFAFFAGNPSYQPTISSRPITVQ